MERAKIAREKRRIRQRDIKDAKNAGIWKSPDELYRDEYGYIKADAPVWYRNFSKAWDANRDIGKENRIREANNYKPKKRRTKKVTKDLNTYLGVYNKKKVSATVRNKSLLEEHGIGVNEDGTMYNIVDSESMEWSDYLFVTSGKIKNISKTDTPPMSVIYFLKNHCET